jgi:translation initiation factor 1
MSMKKSKKHQAKDEEGGIVYSTNPGRNPFAALGDLIDDNEGNTSESSELLHLHFEKKGRNGKPVTLVHNWSSGEVAKEHEKPIKSSCGVGGSYKDETLILQGDQRDKVEAYAMSQDWISKRIGA